MAQEIHPDVFERVSRVVQERRRAGRARGAGDTLPERVLHRPRAGDQQLRARLARDTLTGFAKRAYEFWQKELEPQGYKLRAQIMDFPGGMPGDVGIFLRW